ncbi:hypothetical protein SARC_04816 [Sphaeroforma arctica JP610]|uniref:Uncharacterized protein n=1 Tax=Sphaeroforma arctica JP610 TaxID=667725 RepID=A0A0L0G3X4_9EUKA|nr:hypothetical protein SARC_04816 [Sphaeroforma arctica JP610]KNC82923.1 hypothetical protein SARC_04816 [Sphaeroforma arctica JP610]|eukprot:XP_014156825.1 hypothetical protein SARC_04816 [Sphaeroforma arctica JP610]
MFLPWWERWQGFTHSPAYRKISSKDNAQQDVEVSGFSAQVNLLISYLSERLVMEIHLEPDPEATVTDVIRQLMASYGSSLYLLTRTYSLDLIAYASRLREDNVRNLKEKCASLSEASKVAVKAVIYRLDFELHPR